LLHLAESEIESHLGQTQTGQEKLGARAIGRAESVMVSLKGINERIEDFSGNRHFMPVIFKGPDGQDRIASLNDLQPRTAAEKVISFFSAKSRFEMGTINQVLDERHADLLNERNSLEELATAVRDIANEWDQRLRSADHNLTAHADQRLQPQFTASEIVQIENFAAKETDPYIRAQFENLVHSSLTAGTVADFTELPANGVQPPNPTQLKANDSSRLQDNYPASAFNRPNTVLSESVYSPLGEVSSESEASSESWATLL